MNRRQHVPGAARDMPLLHRPHWSAELTQSLILKDGTKLVTLADAHVCLIGCRTVTFPRGIARGTDRAIELVRKAAETGSFADRKAATDQVVVVLRWRSALRGF
jgi:hypothetical protein